LFYIPAPGREYDEVINMKKKAKWIILAVVALAVIGAGVYAATAPIQVETVTLALSTASETFTEQGVYTYERSYTVYPLVSGEVLEVKVKKGDAVNVGDVLAVVDAVDYREQIEQLTASLAGYNAQIDNLSLQDQQQQDSYVTQLAALKGQLATLGEEMAENSDKAESLEEQISIQADAVRYSRSNVNRTREDLRDLQDWGDETMISQARQAYNAARSALTQNELLLEQLQSGGVPEEFYAAQEEAIQAQIDAMTAQMGKSYTYGMREYYNAQIESTNLTIAQLEGRAGRAEILADMSGTIESLPMEDQNVVSQQQPVAVIGGRPYVEVFVPVREIDGVTVGATAELILDKRLGEETLEGTVVDIADDAEVKLSPLGVEERKIRVLIEPADDLLQIGYTVDARFTVWTQENALTVPKTAVFTADGTDYVWAVRGGKLTRQAIEKDVELRDAYLVTSGLAEGDAVVLDANNTALAEGKSAQS
jgi:HlyD family secretion protein